MLLNVLMWGTCSKNEHISPPSRPTIVEETCAVSRDQCTEMDSDASPRRRMHCAHDGVSSKTTSKARTALLAGCI